LVIIFWKCFFLERNREKEQKSEYISAIIVGLIFLYVVNNLLNWHIYFITNSFNEVLWIINLSIIATIIGNALLLLYSPERLRHVVKIIINIISFIAVYIVYKVFPFNFYNSFYNWGFNILLILAMIGIAIATIVEIYLLVTGKPKLIVN
jgi:peptidoglycan/LPS O-acetylase OafA/YrhL